LSANSDRLLNKLNININVPDKQQEAISEQIKEYERQDREERANIGKSLHERQFTERSKRVTKFYCVSCELELTKLSPKIITGLAKPIKKQRYGCHSCKTQYVGNGYDLVSKHGEEAIVSILEIP